MRFSAMQRIHGTGLMMFCVFAIFMFGYFAVSTFADKDYILCLLFSCFVLLEIVAPIIEFKKWWRELFSTIQFDENGIRNQVIWKEDIFIPWSECVDVGIGVFSRKDHYKFLYFSKEMLTDKEINMLCTIRLNSTHLWVHYRPKVLAEITKYIDESEIKGLEMIKKKRKVRKRERSR